MSTVTGFTPFMLHYAQPACHTIGRMLDGTINPSWSDRLQQALVMEQAAQHTKDSRRYNRERLEDQANAGTLKEGDRVMVKGQRLTPLTARWDHHFIVTDVRGKVVTVLHVPTGKSSKWNRNKIRLVDPEICWEGLKIRPKAQNVQGPIPDSRFAGAYHESHVLLPQQDELVGPPPRGHKRHAPDRQFPMLSAQGSAKVQVASGPSRKRPVEDMTDTDMSNKRKATRSTATKRSLVQQDENPVPAKQASTRSSAEKRELEEDNETPRYCSKRYNFRKTTTKRSHFDDDFEYDYPTKKRDGRTPAQKRPADEATKTQAKRFYPNAEADEVAVQDRHWIRDMDWQREQQWKTLAFVSGYLTAWY